MQKLSSLLSSRNLWLRLLTSLVLAPFALYVAWVGGKLAVIVVTAEAAYMFYEWNRLVRGQQQDFLLWFLGALLIVTGYALGAENYILLSALCATATALTLASFIAPLNLALWTARGSLYALSLLVPIIMLRQSRDLGFEACVLLLLIVWTTDIFSYLAGKIVGGPRLWPSISPHKTWAGFCGGLLGGIIMTAAAAVFLDLPLTPLLFAVGFMLALAAQGGDLLESWVKRQFQAKDAGTAIPGHGGLLDRLDSLVAASLAAYIIGALHADWLNSAEGLLLW